MVKTRTVVLILVCVVFLCSCGTLLQNSSIPQINEPTSSPSIDCSTSAPSQTEPPLVSSDVTPQPSPIPTFDNTVPSEVVNTPIPAAPFDLSSVPAYSGLPWVEVNGNCPYFSEADMTTEAFEKYSPRDDLNRCGVAFANICLATMPSDERGNIGMIKPSGWHTVRYDDLISDKYLYNRCHLIGYQLAGENANEDNVRVRENSPFRDRKKRPFLVEQK